jgi:protein-tyrosine phosphatase
LWRAYVNPRSDGPRRGDSCPAERGNAVAVHCRAGIGRSSLIAACVLVLLGFAPGMAFDLIGKARGVKVPDTEEQRDWVDMFREVTKTGGIKAG